MKPHIKDFFNFLEEKEGKRVSLKAKLSNPDDFKISPEELNVEGDLRLNSTEITQLPNNLQVGGDLWIYRTSITKLPDNLHVGGSLYLYYTYDKQLPDNLQVGGDLYLYGTPISKTMSRKQIRQKIEKKGGYVNGTINI